MEITRTSMISGETRTRDLPITPEQVAAYEGGKLVQDAFPNLSDSDREFFVTGITDEEWDEAFPEEDEPEFTPEQCADAKADLDRYCRAMAQPNGWSTCLAIERKWGLDGLTPEMVTSELVDISESRDEPAF